MGKYINRINGEDLGASFAEKTSALEKAGAESVPEPDMWVEGLVCVVNNGFFAAAAYCYSEEEMAEFKYPDGRQKQWFIYEEAKVFAS